MQRTNTKKNSERDESLIRYFGEISNIPLLSSQEEVELAQKIRNGSRKALTKLIQANLRFVVRVALDYKNQGLPLADLINEGNVVGWFQGRMEWGPRALGNRSIIGDARNSEMQKKLNLKIKFRENFRPFAPSVIIEDINTYF